LRKSTWVSLVIALLVAAATGLLERSARITSCDRRPGLERRADYNAAFFMQAARVGDAGRAVQDSRQASAAQDIVIIGVDNQSLQELHQWPWPRAIHARLIRTLEKTRRRRSSSTSFSSILSPPIRPATGRS